MTPPTTKHTWEWAQIPPLVIIGVIVALLLTEDGRASAWIAVQAWLVAMAMSGLGLAVLSPFLIVLSSRPRRRGPRKRR